MNKFTPCTWWAMVCATVIGISTFCPQQLQAVTNLFFSSSQTTNLVSADVTSDTISSLGYLFTVTRDKLFTGGVGLTNPIGRMVRVAWPAGLEAQAVTSGPTPGGAKFVIKRQDGQPFAIASFTTRLLANTAGAGAAIEVMPMLNGEDGVRDPYAYNATGYYGTSFNYNTPELTGYDAYKITLYVDFALTRLTVVDDSPPAPVLDVLWLNADTIELSWPTSATGYKLVTSPHLRIPLWTAATDTIITNGDLCVAQIRIGETQRYFQLRK